MEASRLPASKVTVVSDEAPLNASFPMEVTLDGIVMAVSKLEFMNALVPMEARLLPVSKVTVASFPAPEKAKFPMVVTEAGIVIEVSAFGPEPVMDVTFAGIVTAPKHSLLMKATLLVIVKVPEVEQFTVPLVSSYVVACAGVEIEANSNAEIVTIGTNSLRI
jgi:hypothetical protein